MRTIISLACVFWLMTSALLFGQSEQYVVTSIAIEGNNKTKDIIILRELTFAVNDTIVTSNLDSLLQQNKNFVFNIGVFNEVEIGSIKSSQNLSIEIVVDEGWYWFPSPLFELIDDNFNEWWNVYNHDLSRTKYGVKLKKYNVFGLNQTFDFALRLGFTQQFTIEYDIPFVDKQRIYGIRAKFNYSGNRRVSTGILNNQENALEIQLETMALSKYEGIVSVTRRKQYTTRHTFELGFQASTIADSVVVMNPNYFAYNTTEQRFFILNYILSYSDRDVSQYPLTGRYFRFDVSKRGLGIYDDLDILVTNIAMSQYFQINKRNYVSFNFRVGGASDDNIPLYNRLKMGREPDFIRGYENYAIHYTSYQMLKAMYRFNIFDKIWNQNLLKVDEFRKIPIEIYVKTFAEIARISGYSDQLNVLNNSMLSGYGVGLDVVFWHDVAINMEYSINRDGESGFYLHVNTVFDK